MLNFYPFISTCFDDSWSEVSSSSLTPHQADWLLETGSLTRRFEQLATQIKIKRLVECYISSSAIESGRHLLPNVAIFWKREVILYADDQPWLYGITLIPQSTLVGEQQHLIKLGDRPLGHYLFNSINLVRDFIQIRQCETLLARRSLLRLDNKPLLLTELFLPQSPLYLP